MQLCSFQLFAVEQRTLSSRKSIKSPLTTSRACGPSCIRGEQVHVQEQAEVPVEQSLLVAVRTAERAVKWQVDSVAPAAGWDAGWAAGSVAASSALLGAIA